MNTLTKLVLGKMGRLRPKPLPAAAEPALVLPAPEKQGAAPLTAALAARRAGAIGQNVYLYAAANGLATALRAWIDREAIADALGLTHDDDVLLSQTVGYPRDGSA